MSQFGKRDDTGRREDTGRRPQFGGRREETGRRSEFGRRQDTGVRGDGTQQNAPQQDGALRRIISETALRFSPVRLLPPLEEEYDFTAATQNARSTFVGTVLMIMMITVHALASHALFPAGLPPFMDVARSYLVMVTVAVVTAALFVRLKPEWLARVAPSFGALALFVVAQTTILAVFAGDLERRRLGFAVCELLLIVIYMLFRFRPFFASFTGWTTTIFYLYSASAYDVYPEDRFVQIAMYLIIMNLIGMVVAFLVERQERQIFLTLVGVSTEKARADSMLANVLPETVAERLKNGREGGIAEAHPEATILQADLVGFTALAAKLSPVDLVSMLDELFTEFDRIMARHGVEKVKTEGDAYIAAAGLPLPMHHHALRAASAGLDIVDAVHAFSKARGISIDVRVGLDTGYVVAGVIGKQKQVYDIWGAPVTGAARLEAQAEPGAVLVSAVTAEHLDEYLTLTGGPAVFRLLRAGGQTAV